MNTTVATIAFNWYDFVVLLALVFGVWSGIRTGLLEELMRVLGLLLMAGLALWLYPMVGHWLHEQSGWAAEPANLIAFVAIATLTYAVSLGVRAWLHRRMKKKTLPAFLENTGGAILGCLRMVVVMACISIALTLVRSPFWHQHIARESQFGAAVVSRFPAVAAVSQREFPENFLFFRDLTRPHDPDYESERKPK